MELQNLFLGAITLSVLHGLIPSHWMPLIVLSKKYQWTLSKTMAITLLAGLGHVISTGIIGIVLALIGAEIQSKVEIITHTFSGALLILLGIWFLIRHYHHHHFHLDEKKIKRSVIVTIFLSMLFSPCLEIIGFYFSMAKFPFIYIVYLSILYFCITILSMLIYVYLFYKTSKKIDSHKIEHNAGLLAGLVLIVCGILVYFF